MLVSKALLILACVGLIHGSCVGVCGKAGKAPLGEKGCYCDHACFEQKDCCADINDVCSKCELLASPDDCRSTPGCKIGPDSVCRPDPHSLVAPLLVAVSTQSSGFYRVFNGKDSGVFAHNTSRTHSVTTDNGLLNHSFTISNDVDTNNLPTYFGLVWLPSASVRPGDTIRGYALFRTRPSLYSTRLILENTTSFLHLVDPRNEIVDVFPFSDTTTPIQFFNLSTSKYLAAGKYQIRLVTNSKTVATTTLEIIRYKRPDIKVASETQQIPCVMLPGTPSFPNRALACAAPVVLNMAYFHGTPVASGTAKVSLVHKDKVTDCVFTTQLLSLHSAVFSQSMSNENRSQHEFHNGTLRANLVCYFPSIQNITRDVNSLFIRVDVEDTMSRKGMFQFTLEEQNVFQVKLSAYNGTLQATIGVKKSFVNSEPLTNLNITFGILKYSEELAIKESFVLAPNDITSAEEDRYMFSFNTTNFSHFYVNNISTSSYPAQFSWCVRLRMEGVIVVDRVCALSFHDKVEPPEAREDFTAASKTTAPEQVQAGNSTQPNNNSNNNKSPKLSIVLDRSQLYSGDLALGKISLAASCSFLSEMKKDYPNIFLDVITDSLSISLTLALDFDEATRHCNHAKWATLETPFEFNIPEDYQGLTDLHAYFHPSLMMQSQFFTHRIVLENQERILHFAPETKASVLVLPRSFLHVFSTFPSAGPPSVSSQAQPSPAFTVSVPAEVGTGQPINVQIDVNDLFFEAAVNHSSCRTDERASSGLWFAVALADERMLAEGYTPTNLDKGLLLTPERRPKLIWRGSVQTIAEGRAEIHVVEPPFWCMDSPPPSLRIIGNFPPRVTSEQFNVTVGGIECIPDSVESIFSEGPAHILKCNLALPRSPNTPATTLAAVEETVVEAATDSALTEGKVPVVVTLNNLPTFGSVFFEWKNASGCLRRPPRLATSHYHPVHATVIGIDVGLENSYAAIKEQGKIDIIANSDGNRYTPSTVVFDSKGEPVVLASGNTRIPARRVVTGVKRLIGRTYAEVMKEFPDLPYEVVNRDGLPYVRIAAKEEGGEEQQEDRFYSPQAIVSFIINQIKDNAEAQLGRRVNHAVLGVPAYFNDAQRQAMKDAGVIAGVQVLRIINEPTAALIAYGADTHFPEPNIVVYDLGSGAFDVAVLSVDSGVFEVIATNGNRRLGGADYDRRLLAHFLNLPGTPQTPKFRYELSRQLKRAKHALTTSYTTKIEVEHGDTDISWNLTRAKFEDLTSDLALRTILPLDAVLKDAHLERHQIDEVVMIGGATRMPHIQNLVKNYFDNNKRNPAHKNPIFSTGIHAEEAVAWGLAQQGAVLSGEEETNDILLLDIWPLSLGVRVGNVYNAVIPRNSVIPTRRSQVFKTATTQPNQQIQLAIGVFQGEREQAEDNQFLQACYLDVVSNEKKEVEVEVTLDLDINALIHLHAMDKLSGKIVTMTISNEKSRLSSEEIERMIMIAESYEAEEEYQRNQPPAEIQRNKPPPLELPEVILRTTFPDAIVMEPVLVTQRSFNVSVPPTDSITSYRLFAMLVAEKEAHTIEKAVLVRNRVFSATTTPPFMTLGDELWISTVVENIGNLPLSNVSVSASTNDKIEVLACDVKDPSAGKCTRSSAVSFGVLGAGRSVVVNWKLRAKSVGDAELMTSTVGTDSKNQLFVEVSKLQAPLYVGPPGSPLVDVYRISLAANETWKFTPSFSFEDKQPVFALGVVSMLPSLNLAVIDGVEALAAYPYGCCEQTSASTLPNVVAYRYLERIEKLTPEVRDMLLTNMRAGRDRYLENFYNHRTGGFGLWSGEQTSSFHTALATGVLGALSEFIPVDPHIFTAARSYLEREMQLDGSFLQSGGVDRLFPSTLNVVATSAYIAHSLSLGNQVLQPTLEFLLLSTQRAALLGDSAALAMVVDTISRMSSQLPLSITSHLAQLTADLRSLVLVDEKQNYYWSRGSGLTSPIETTSYALSALARGDFDQTILLKGASYLLDKRTSSGWLSTRDTVFAAMALADIAQATPQSGVSGSFAVGVGGREISLVDVTPENMHLAIYRLRNIFVDNFDLDHNANELELSWNGVGEVRAVVEIRKWYAEKSKSAQHPLTIEQRLLVANNTDDRPSKLSVTYSIGANLLNPGSGLQAIMLEQRVPAGCVLRSGVLEKLQTAEGVNHVELNTHDKQPLVGVFLSSLEHLREKNASLTFAFDFDANHRGEVLVDGLRVLPMYAPETAFASQGFLVSL